MSEDIIDMIDREADGSESLEVFRCSLLRCYLFLFVQGTNRLEKVAVRTGLALGQGSLWTREEVHLPKISPFSVKYLIYQGLCVKSMLGVQMLPYD